jgi:4'-phosphopantetheinyl transferase
MQPISSQITAQLPFEGQFYLDQLYSLSQGILNQLNETDKKELDSFTNVLRQQEYVTSRLLLKEMAKQMGINVAAFAVQKDELGRPYGRTNDKQFCVSIAHTDEMVFCGLTRDTSIGVDLEPVDRKVPEKLKQRILHPGEEVLFSRLETIRIWTIKEAYIKLRGKGLRLNMNKVHLEQDGDHFFVEINNDKRAKICSFQAHSNWLAIAYYQ